MRGARGEGDLPPARARDGWRDVRDRLHQHGLRWTPQRRILVEVLRRTRGHVTGAELVERCRAVDPTTAPSTIYRTLDVLEDVGLVSHSHGLDGREEYHVLPTSKHGHLQCSRCGRSWELGPERAEPVIERLAPRGFRVDVSHLSVAGICEECDR